VLLIGKKIELIGTGIVRNLTLPSRAVARFYNERGTAEQWIKEGKQATHWARLSCRRFRANEAHSQLRLLAYNLGNLGNLWRRLVLPKRIGQWSPTSLQQRCVENKRAFDQARPVLLAAAGRGSSDMAALPASPFLFSSFGGRTSPHAWGSAMPKPHS
jgi:hypothetical protein